jgi:Na+/phosphate symporter
METRLTIFLAFVFIALATNTLLIWFVYRTFLGVTSKLTETLTEMERSGTTRDFLRSLETAAREAATVTGATKQRMAELDPMMERTQEKYARALAAADSKLEQAAAEVSDSAAKMRDVVAKPAMAVMGFVAGLSSSIGAEPEE